MSICTLLIAEHTLVKGMVIFMKLHFLGTCAGTEPIAGINHQSTALEINDTLYWFDAGACSSRTAHIMGLDLLKVKKVIISHTHMDHVGGLGNLFWDIRKMKWVKQQEPKFDFIDLYIPEIATWNGFLEILNHSEGDFDNEMAVKASVVSDGVLFADENMKVTALHNEHIRIHPGDSWKSFSYLIEAEGKRIVYSGDIAAISELTPFIKDGCDALLIETGHHKYLDVCDYMNGKKIKNLFFTHKGWSILSEPMNAIINAQNSFDGNVMICSDATTVIL